MTFRLLICAAALLAGCSDFPKDPESTLDRVRTERRFAVGVTQTAVDRSPAEVSVFLKRMEDRTGSYGELNTGSTEPLLKQLERGELDIVIADFAIESPWSKKVALSPALEEHVSGSEHVLIAAAARNGENAWIELLHREALAVRAGR